MTLQSIHHPPHHPTPGNRPGDGQPAIAKRAAEQYALIAASTVIVALTAGAFWLSYAHLADVAGQHGLGTSPVRRWTWPATLDAFIVAGELLMLRAGLRRVTDAWAIALTAAGAVGSIALNVAGVNGTGNAATVPFLDYVVAAVPPTAAMLAFGVLMRQIHQLIDQPADRPEPGSTQVPEPPVTTSAQPAEPPAEPVQAAEPPAESVRPTGPPAAVSDRLAEPPSEVAESKPRGGRPASASIEELVEIGRIAAAEHGKLTRDLLRKAVKDKGLTIASERVTDVMNILKPELEAKAGTASASG